MRFTGSAGMSMTQTKRLRLVTEKAAAPALDDPIAVLKLHADNIADTAKRCTDPQVVSELQSITQELIAAAARLEKN